MPNLEGTGPRNAGRRNGYGFRRCFANNRVGTGPGFGRRLVRFGFDDLEE